VAKPDGLCVVDPAIELEFLHNLPVELMWGVGPATKARLNAEGVVTIGQLAMMPGRSLDSLLGPAASEKLHALAFNRDPRSIDTDHRARSAGAQSALGRQPATDKIIRPTLRHLADRIGSRLRAKALAGRRITVRVRWTDLKAVTHAVTLDAPVAATSILTEVAHELVREVLDAHPEESHISLLAISVSHLEQQPMLQLELSLGLADEAWRPGARRGASRLFADRAMDKVRDRFGWEAIGYGSVMLEGRRLIPDAFRELAEKKL
jgi:DNA polymerase-4